MKKLLFFLLPLATLTSCDYVQKIKPSGKSITKEITQDPIFTINNGSSYDIVFTNDIPKNTVYIKGDEAFVENIQIIFDNGTITFENKEQINTIGNDLKILMNAPDVTSLTINGASDITAPNYIFKNNLSLTVSGAGDIEIEVNNESTDVAISGAGDIELKGTSKKIIANISGTGDLDAKQLIAEQGSIGISGVGAAKVHVTQQLNATVSGTGSLSYKKVANLSVQESVTGVGTINSY